MDYQLLNNINEIQGLGKDINNIRREVYDLWQECFHDSNSYMNFYMTWKVKDNQILSIYKGSLLCSMLHLNPYVIVIKGKKVPLNYIVGVATRQQERKKGLMRSLLQTSLCQMYRDHMPFTYLMPAAEAIYLPFGFRIVYKHEAWSQFFHNKLQNQLKIAEFNLHSSEFLTAISLKEQDKARIQEVVEFSNFHLSKQFDIYAYRTDYYYIRLFHEMECTGGEIVLFYDENRLIGYISYMADEGFYISECIYDSEQEDIFIRSVCNYMIQLEKKLKMEEINKINYFNPCIMARIIDFESFVSYLTAEEELHLIIQVNDPIITENNGVFDLHFSRNGCELVKCSKEPEIAGDVSDLTRLFFGQMDHREQIKMITGKDKSLVNDRLRKINTFNKVLINDIV